VSGSPGRVHAGGEVESSEPSLGVETVLAGAAVLLGGLMLLLALPLFDAAM